MVASIVSGSGRIKVSGGSGYNGLPAAGGKIRIEALTNTYTGTITGASSGSVVSFTSPAIPSNLPTLQITSVGGIDAPANPTGDIGTPDIVFPAPPTNPVTIDIAASNIPLGTTVDLRITPAIGMATTVTSTGLAGTFGDSTATASATIPPGFGAITAIASVMINASSPTFAGLALPKIDGAAPERVDVVSTGSGTTRLFLVGREGTRIELEQGGAPPAPFKR
jgi:hypothetical protein